MFYCMCTMRIGHMIGMHGISFRNVLHFLNPLSVQLPPDWLNDFVKKKKKRGKTNENVQ